MCSPSGPEECGQAQFIEHALPSDSPGAMTPLLTWMEQHLSRELPLQVIAVSDPGVRAYVLTFGL